MSSDTQIPENVQPVPSSSALMPDMMSTQTDIDSIVDSCGEYPLLSEAQKKVLIGIMQDFLSESIRKDADLARDCKVHPNTIRNCKQSARFNRVLVAIMPELVKSKLPKYLLQIEKHGQKSYEPLKFLLEYTGLYVKSQRNLNINAQLDSYGTPGDPKQAAFAIAEQFISVGYDRQAFIEILTEAYDTLRSEGI